MATEKSCRRIPDPLPDDLVFSILLRLPVKDLIRFTRVSKAWLSLISSPRFSNAYLELSPFRRRRFVFLSNYRPYAWPLWPQPGEEPLEFRFFSDGPDHDDSIQIVGSCNGLVCLASSSLTESVFVWNPATRIHRKIDVPSEKGGFHPSFGFGYDASSDDYKVMRFCEEDERKSRFMTYSLRNDSWQVSDWSHGPVHSPPGVFLNGALHWIVDGIHSPRDWCVVAISLSSHNRSSIALPVPPSKSRIGSACLGVSEIWLCAIFNRGFSKDVWVMTEYGVKESWTRLLSFSSPFDIKGIRPFGEVIPYKPFEYLRNFGLTDVLDGQAITYSESLVSPYLDPT